MIEGKVNSRPVFDPIRRRRIIARHRLVGAHAREIGDRDRMPARVGFGIGIDAMLPDRCASMMPAACCMPSRTERTKSAVAPSKPSTITLLVLPVGAGPPVMMPTLPSSMPMALLTRFAAPPVRYYPRAEQAQLALDRLCAHGNATAQDVRQDMPRDMPRDMAQDMGHGRGPGRAPRHGSSPSRWRLSQLDLACEADIPTRALALAKPAARSPRATCSSTWPSGWTFPCASATGCWWRRD
jgi:hypothetical protein